MSYSTFPKTIIVHIKNIINDINKNSNLIAMTRQSDHAFVTTLVNHTEMNLFIFDLKMLEKFTQWSMTEYFTEKTYGDIFKEFPALQISIFSEEKIKNLFMNYFFKLSQYLEKMHKIVENDIYNFQKDDLFLFLFKALDKSILKENVCSKWILSANIIT